MTLPLGPDSCHPDREAILAAIFDWEPVNDPILLGARTLTRAHEQRWLPKPDTTAITAARAETIGNVDAWVDTCYGHYISHIADLHTETVGSALDRLASYAATLRCDDTIGVLRMESGWRRVDELAGACAELLDDVVHGLRRLPHSLAYEIPSCLDPKNTDRP